jgi:hypothetical protein
VNYKQFREEAFLIRLRMEFSFVPSSDVLPQTLSFLQSIPMINSNDLLVDLFRALDSDGLYYQHGPGDIDINQYDHFNHVTNQVLSQSLVYLYRMCTSISLSIYLSLSIYPSIFLSLSIPQSFSLYLSLHLFHSFPPRLRVTTFEGLKRLIKPLSLTLYYL